jgi:hypothetical protein
MTWAKIVAGLLSFLNSLVAWFKAEAIRKAERDAIEVEARREHDRLVAAADAARNSVSRDPADIAADPNNRRRSVPKP